MSKDFFEFPDNDVTLNNLKAKYNNLSIKKQSSTITDKILTNQLYVGTGTTQERAELKKHITELISCNCYTLQYIINYTVQMGYQFDEVKRMVQELTNVDPNEVYNEGNNEYYHFPGTIPGYNKGWGVSKDKSHDFYFINPMANYYCVFGQKAELRDEIEHCLTLDEAFDVLKKKVKTIYAIDKVFTDKQLKESNEYQEPSTNSQIPFTQNLSTPEKLKDQLKKNKISKASLLKQANEYLTDMVITPEEYEDVLNYTNEFKEGTSPEIDFPNRFPQMSDYELANVKKGESIVLIDGTNAQFETPVKYGFEVKLDNGTKITVSASDILYRKDSFKYIESKYSTRKELRNKIARMASKGKSLDDVKYEILINAFDTSDSVGFTEKDVENTFNKVEDKIPGGLADGKPDELFSEDWLAKGTEVESEHTDNPEIAKEIAKDHLTEDKDYYKKLKKIESARFYYGEKFVDPDTGEIYVFEKINPNSYNNTGLMKYDKNGKKLSHNIEWMSLEQIHTLLDNGDVKLLPKNFSFSMPKEEGEDNIGEENYEMDRQSSLIKKADESEENEDKTEDKKTKDNNDIFKERTPQDFFENEISQDFVGSINKKVNECLNQLNEHIELIEAYEIKIKKYATDISDPETKDMTADAADAFFSSDAIVSVILYAKPKDFDVAYKKLLTIYTINDSDIDWNGTVKAENGNYYALTEEGLNDLFKKELQEVEEFDQETI